MNIDDKEQIRGIIADVCEITISDVKDVSDFADDLGMDSMMMLEILALIEKRLGIIIPEETFQGIKSMNFSALIDLISAI